MRIFTILAYVLFIFCGANALIANADGSSISKLPGTAIEPQISFFRPHSNGKSDNDLLNAIKSDISLCILDAEGGHLILALEKNKGIKDDGFEKIYIQLVNQILMQSEELAESLVDADERIFDGFLKYIEFLDHRALLSIPVLSALEEGLKQAIIHDRALIYRLETVQTLKEKLSQWEWKSPTMGLVEHFAKWLDKRYNATICDFIKTKDRAKFASTRKLIHTGIDLWGKIKRKSQHLGAWGIFGTYNHHNKSYSHITSTIRDDQSVEKVFAQAKSAYFDQKYDEAIALFLKARIMDPVYCAENGVHNQIAQCYRRMSDFDSALDYLRQSIATDQMNYRRYSFHVARGIFVYDLPDELSTALAHAKYFEKLAFDPPGDWIELQSAAWYEAGQAYETRIVEFSNGVEDKEQAYVNAINAYISVIDQYFEHDDSVDWFFPKPAKLCWDVAELFGRVSRLFQDSNDDKYEQYTLKAVDWFRRFQKDYPDGAPGQYILGDAQYKIFITFYLNLGQHFLIKLKAEQARQYYLVAIAEGKIFVNEFHENYMESGVSLVFVINDIAHCYRNLAIIHQKFLLNNELVEEYSLQAVNYFRDVLKIPTAPAHMRDGARTHIASLYDSMTNIFYGENPIKAKYYGDLTITAYQDIISNIESESTVVNAKLSIGRIHQLFERYTEALVYFKLILSEHANSNLSCAHAQYLIGTCYFDLREYDTAIIEFNRVKDNYPESPNVYMHGNAEFGIGNCYFEKGEYRQATSRYLNLIKTYGSLHSAYAQCGDYGLKRTIALRITPRPASVPADSSIALNATISYPNEGTSDLIADYIWKWEQTGEADAGAIISSGTILGKNANRSGASSQGAIFAAGNREGAMATVKVSVTFDAQTATLSTGVRALPVTIEDEISFSIGSDPGYGCGFFAWNTFAKGTNLYSGNHVITATDLNISAPGLSLTQSRVYNSKAERAGLFGKGWQAWYEERLWPVKDSRGRTVSLAMTDSTGAKFDLFEIPGKGQEFSPPAGMYFTVKAQSDGTYALTDKAGISKLFNGLGALYRIVERNENVLEISWEEGIRGTKGLCAAQKIRLYNWKTPEFYRELILKTDGDGRIIEAKDPLGRTATYEYSGDLLISVNLPLGYREICSYDDKDRLILRSLPGGYSESFEYDQSGRLISRTTPDGTERFSFDSRSRRAAVTDCTGQISRYQLDNLGRLSGFVSPLDNASSQVWDSNHNIISAIDPLGKTSAFTWDSLGNMTGITDRTGAKTNLSWDPAFSVLSGLSDANGNAWAMELDAYGNPTRISRPDNGETRITYGIIPGLPLRIVDALGNSWMLKYDQYGYITSVTDPLSGTTTIIRDKAGRPLRVVNALGGITDNTFNALDQLAARLNPDGGAEYFTYDLLGNLKTYTDPEGGKTTYMRDPFGRLVEMADALNRKTVYGYDAEGRLTAITDPVGRTRKFEYDAEGKITTIFDADGSSETISYDAAGRPICRMDSRENNWISSVDGEGRFTEFIDPSGGAINRRLDPVGNIISVKDSLARTVNMTYTPLNLVESIADSAGMTTFERDRLDRVIKAIDALGNVKTYEYDALGRLITITDALNNKTGYVWDPLGRLKEITDGRGNTRLFDYDPMGRLVQETDEQGNKRTYAWNRRGDLLARTDALDRNITYIRDALGRIISIKYPERTVAISYNLAGNVEKISANTISAEYLYDIRDRLVQTIWHPYGWTVRYEYDTSSNCTKLIDPEGKATKYKYDGRNLLIRLTDPWDREYLFEYDKTGMRTGKFMPDGTKCAYGYDGAGRLEEIQSFSGSMPLFSRKITRDALGNVLAIKEPGGTNNFAYDSLSRLTDASYFDGAREKFVYDEVGNRVKQTGIGIIPTTYIYNRSNQLISATTPDTKTEYTWDPEGNLIRKTVAESKTGHADEVQIFEWDSENRLIKAHIQAEEATEIRFAYSPSGERLAKSVNGKKTYFCPDGDDVLGIYEMIEGDSGGLGKNSTGLENGRIQNRRYLLLQNRFIHGPMVDEHLAMISFDPETRKPKTHFFHQDERNSVLGITNSTGQIVGKWTERSFGQRLPIQEFATPYGFTGREFEEKLGLNFHRARFYDPDIGRFISMDPVFGDISNPITQHPYVYGNLNPFRFVDPWGLEGTAYITYNYKKDDPIYLQLKKNLFSNKKLETLLKNKGYKVEVKENYDTHSIVKDIIVPAVDDVWIHFSHGGKDSRIQGLSRDYIKKFVDDDRNEEIRSFKYVYVASCYSTFREEQVLEYQKCLQGGSGFIWSHNNNLPSGGSSFEKNFSLVFGGFIRRFLYRKSFQCSVAPDIREIVKKGGSAFIGFHSEFVSPNDFQWVSQDIQWTLPEYP